VAVENSPESIVLQYDWTVSEKISCEYSPFIKIRRIHIVYLHFLTTNKLPIGTHWFRALRLRWTST